MELPLGLTAADALIIIVTLGLALAGLSQGFIVGALSLGGLLAGAFAGTRLGPLLLEEGARSAYTPLFGLLGAIIVGGVLAAALEGIGLEMRSRIRARTGRMLDRLLGAALTAAAALLLAWLVGAILLNTPATRNLRVHVQQSVILQELNARMPPSGPILNVLQRFDPLPGLRGPSITAEPPTSETIRDPEVRAAARSLVRVLGSACGLGVSGSGWVAAPQLVVTNAHVIAGQRDTHVQLAGAGEELRATVVHVDARNDLALLVVPGLDARPLSLDPAPQPGTGAAILGYPNNGGLRLTPARMGETQRFAADDAWGRGPVLRKITSFRGAVDHGNSGGPVLDGEGEVLTTVFAGTVGSPVRGGYGVPNDIVADALAGAGRHAVDTGPCGP